MMPKSEKNFKRDWYRSRHYCCTEASKFCNADEERHPDATTPIGKSGTVMHLPKDNIYILYSQRWDWGKSRKWIRNYANRKIRRMDGIPEDHGWYKRNGIVQNYIW